jgi:hypothetical protein
LTPLRTPHFPEISHASVLSAIRGRIAWLDRCRLAQAKTHEPLLKDLPDMPSDAFIKGFRHELANRAFALLAVERLAGRTQGTEQFALWSAYCALERFNAAIYAAAAANWGLDDTPGWWPSFKAWAFCSVPRIFESRLMRFVYAETHAYVDELKVLQRIGPVESRTFLDYMVAQEELQVEMMELAMAMRFAEIEPRVGSFINEQLGLAALAKA